MFEVFRRALYDTRVQAGGAAGLLLAVLGPVLGIMLQTNLQGARGVTLDWNSIVYGLAGFGCVVLLLFIANLVCAPFRIERDRRLEADRRIADLAAKLADDNPLRVDPITGATVIKSGGQPMSIIGGVFRGGLRIEGGDDGRSQ